MSFKRLTCQNETTGFYLSSFFGSVEVLHMNRAMVSSHVFRIADCIFSLFKSSSVKQFHFSDNDISDFEFEFQNENIEDTHLSNNHIRAILPKSLSGITSLKRVDLSRNVIHIACSTSATFMIIYVII